MTATRSDAIEAATVFFDSGDFIRDLAKLVEVETDSRSGTHIRQLRTYLDDHLAPYLSEMDFECSVHTNPASDGPPFLLAARTESPNLPTVLCYGHGDVTPGTPELWREGISPFKLAEKGDRVFGRGTADNKGQHLVNMAAARLLLQVQGKLGFNLKFLIEMGEEKGSPGLCEFISENSEILAADVLIASDGPRLHAATPTVFTGARGCINFELVVKLRPDARHSGNWGGVLADPSVVLAHAIASICDQHGQLRVSGWRPESLTPDVRSALKTLPDLDESDDQAIDRNWGEAELTPAERLFGWNAFTVLAIQSGSVSSPDHAIQPSSRAVCQLRFVVGTSPKDIVPELRRHLSESGLDNVEVVERPELIFDATRTDPTNAWVQLVLRSIRKTTRKEVHYLPNLGGSIPNEYFARTLGLPTVWVPHSYRGCSQHAPDEHNLASLFKEGLQIMTGVFWDIGHLEGDFACNKIDS